MASVTLGRRSSFGAPRSSGEAAVTPIFLGDAEVGTIEGLGDPTLWSLLGQWHMTMGGGNDAGDGVDLYDATLTAGVQLDAPASSWTISTTKISPARSGYNAFGIETPSFVIGGGNVIRQYYTAVEGTGTPGTDAFAMSYLQLNGANWEDHGEAVLTGAESWELNNSVSFVSECNVLWDNGKYHAFYTAGSSLITGYANSADGNTWGNKVQVFPSANFTWSPHVYKVGKHYEMIIATVSVGSKTTGLYRLRSKTIEGGGHWVDSHQIYRLGQHRYSALWAYGATTGRLPNGNIAVYFTGRDNAGGAGKPNILRIIIAPMKDF